MITIKNNSGPALNLKDYLLPLVYAVPVALITGSLVALFYYLLNLATTIHWQHNWLLYFLPFAGVAIHFIYKFYGKNAERGNTLIIEEIHKPGGGVPARMAPLVLITTLITHLFGGSAGREGTAVQMGGSIAGWLSGKSGLSRENNRIMLMCGIAAGFGAIFGTPAAGAVFAIEVVNNNEGKYRALIPCIAASLLADFVSTAWGIHHVNYHLQQQNMVSIIAIPSVFLLLKAAMAGIAFGMAAWLFINLQDNIKAFSNRYIKPSWMIPVIGGSLIIVLCIATGTRDYTGLGVISQYPGGISIVSSFHAGGAANWSWLWKIIFTAITLGTGFKGGEVTPLFFIGATLGNTLAWITGAPVDLFAALGFIAVFAGATKTPVASIILGIELFGTQYLPYYLVACFAAHFFSGKPGIYTSKIGSGGKAGR